MLDLVLTTAPSAELLTLAQAKDHLRLTGVTDWDDLVQDQLDSAVAQLDGYAGRLGRALATQGWTLYLDAFPRCGMSLASAAMFTAIKLPLPPLISVQSVKYLAAADGALTTLTAVTDYEVFAGERAEIRPAYGKSWPSARAQARAVTIAFTAGFAEISAGVWPAKLQPVRAALKLLVEQEFAGADPTRTDAINRLLKPLKIPRL